MTDRNRAADGSARPLPASTTEKRRSVEALPQPEGITPAVCLQPEVER